MKNDIKPNPIPPTARKCERHAKPNFEELFRLGFHLGFSLIILIARELIAMNLSTIHFPLTQAGIPENSIEVRPIPESSDPTQGVQAKCQGPWAHGPRPKGPGPGGANRVDVGVGRWVGIHNPCTWHCFNGL